MGREVENGYCVNHFESSFMSLLDCRFNSPPGLVPAMSDVLTPCMELVIPESWHCPITLV